MAVLPDGTVWCWGDNQAGQLGEPIGPLRLIPVKVAGLSDVAAVTGGGLHSLALTRDGTVWAWGGNWSGELGDGGDDALPSPPRYAPARVLGLTGVSAVAAGGSYSLALTSDGRVWAWGANGFGELGDGTTAWRRSTPARIPNLTGVIAIGAGVRHSVALKSDGTVWTWGSNQYGQLGDGTGSGSATPVRVAGLSTVLAIGTGSYHVVALKSDGTLWAWGFNESGQLGDNSRVQRLAPVQGPTLKGVTAIAAGVFHTVVRTTDGAVWSWGGNGSGQLGDGTFFDRPLPVRALGF